MELSCEQTIRCRGVCAPALEPRGEWEGFRKRCQGFKPDLGNSAVRHYRGASGNVAMAELRTHLATERVRVVSLRLKQTRPSSIPTIDSGCTTQCAIPGSGRIFSINLGVRKSTMRWTRFFTTLLTYVVLTTSLHANC